MIDQKLFEEAARAVRSAAEKLDVQGAPCPTCGRMHYRGWNEKQMHDELLAMVRKLDKFAARDEPALARAQAHRARASSGPR